MTDMELDTGLLHDFITEATELLDDYTASLTTFEEDPEDLETINPVFRAAHTLKGSSAFFGFNHIKDFAHILENLLDDIRNKKRETDSSAIEYLFLGGNHLKDMFERLSAGDLKPQLTNEEEAFQQELSAWMGGQGANTQAEGDSNYQKACANIKLIISQALEEAREPAELIEDIMAVIASLPLESSSSHLDEGDLLLPAPISASYNGEDISEKTLKALANINAQSFDPQSFDEDLKSLINQAEEKNWTEIIALLMSTQEDFLAVYESALDFDPVLVGLVKEKYETFLGAIDLVYPVRERKSDKTASDSLSRPEFISYKGADLSEEILKLFDDLYAPSFDADKFSKDIKTLQNIFAEKSWLDISLVLDDLADDFTAVHESPLDFDEMLVGLLKEKFTSLLGSLELRYEDTSEKEAAPATEGGDPPSRSGAAKAESKSMRIPEEKVDGFMSYVGELIVTAETFNYLQKMIETDNVNPNTVRAFKNANQAFRELSDELQESLMEIRRVPIQGVLQKINMMTRELSRQLGKKVRVQLEGQDVQLDKSIAESLEAPLVHVVRNSLDHGFESTEIREAAGKNPEGLLRVSASSDKEHFYLSVEDDGKGIDPDKMRGVAVDKGLLTEAQAAALSDKEALGLIFGAGFSTAQAITDVSGRGVGMDVVRTNINALNGSINIDSTVGQGTSITLKIPLSVTLQVIKALHVRVGNANFIISLDQILESLRPMADELSSVEGRGLVLNRRGRITPLIKLYEVFNLEPLHREPEDGLLVMVETQFGRYALLVDEVMGQQQVVVKELGAQFSRLSFLSGSALLGDGGLGLVLDATGVVNCALGFNS